MKILYDNQIFRVQKFGGVSRYCAELIHGLQQNKDYRVLPKKFFSNNKHLSELGLTNYNFIFHSPNFPWKQGFERYIKRREEKFLFDKISHGSFDIYHPTYYNPTYLKHLPKGKTLVVTIHDMTYELYYDTEFNTVHQESLNKKQIIQRANHIICPSGNTKNDILKLYPEINPGQISVIYHGCSLPDNIVESHRDLPPTYLLYVGKRGKYKNFTWMLKSLAGFLDKEKISLVCAGGKAFSNDEKKLITDHHLNGRVIYQEISNDVDLATLYKKAACFIYPSSHEGFGIPILESYSCQCPALLAKSSCFPEIAGDGALYFENGNSEQLISQLKQVLSDKVLADDLKKKGAKRLQHFNWKKMVQQHIEVYSNVQSSQE